jgi:hypothetical protein
MIRRAVNDGAGELGEIEPFAGAGGSPPAALLDQPFGEDGTPEAAARPVDTDEALRGWDRERLLQVPLSLPHLLHEIGRMTAKNGGERLKGILVTHLRRPLLPPSLDLPAADGAEALEVLGFDLGEGALVGWSYAAASTVLTRMRHPASLFVKLLQQKRYQTDIPT